jgi:hypothetical protein
MKRADQFDRLPLRRIPEGDRWSSVLLQDGIEASDRTTVVDRVGASGKEPSLVHQRDDAVPQVTLEVLGLEVERVAGNADVHRLDLVDVQRTAQPTRLGHEGGERLDVIDEHVFDRHPQRVTLSALARELTRQLEVVDLVRELELTIERRGAGPRVGFQQELAVALVHVVATHDRGLTRIRAVGLKPHVDPVGIAQIRLADPGDVHVVVGLALGLARATAIHNRDVADPTQFAYGRVRHGGVQQVEEGTDPGGAVEQEQVVGHPSVPFWCIGCTQSRYQTFAQPPRHPPGNYF